MDTQEGEATVFYSPVRYVSTVFVKGNHLSNKRESTTAVSLVYTDIIGLNKLNLSYIMKMTSRVLMNKNSFIKPTFRAIQKWPKSTTFGQSQTWYPFRVCMGVEVEGKYFKSTNRILSRELVLIFLVFLTAEFYLM